MARKTVVRARQLRLVAAIAAFAVVAPALTAVMPAPAGGGGLARPATLLPVRPQRPVPVHVVGSRRVKLQKTRVWHSPGVSWPAAGSGIASVAGAAGTSARGAAAVRQAAGRGNAAMASVTTGSSRAGSVPVWVGPALAGRASAAPGRVRVVMASRRAATAAGVSGVIFTLSRASGLAGTAKVHVSLDYSSFAYADGGGFADRLRLVELPACALTTPRVAACRREMPVASGNDMVTDRLGADVTLPAGAAVMAAVTTPSGSAGNFAATPLADAGSWTAGGSSGAFTYSYPISVPPVPGGLEPQISLAYDSQSLDGLTSSTNDQASWIGDGWRYDPGFIERDYQSCSQDKSLPTSEQTGDLCWSSDNETTMSLGGVTTTLVQDTATGTWHAENDQGEEISFITGTASNGTHDDDYWVVTEQDGTSYYFGENELPGYTSSDAQTDSAWTVPVYATASGQPCYNSSFPKSYCNQAWRWNLDYVTDSHGDAMAFFYNSETNYYAADAGTTATARYTQAGALSKIEYGLRAGSVYGTTPAAEVNFTAPETRTDVPTGSTGDLACASGATCNVQSPTFWGKYQLSTIATESLVGGNLQPADSWALVQSYPTNGDKTTPPALFLQSITQTGEDGGSISLPPVAFTPIGLVNRAETPADLNDGYSLITRFRIGDVVNETGGTTEVTYDTVPTSCTSGNFPAEDDNTTLCYPDYWTPPGSASAIEDWFNKYVVMAVTQVSTQVGSQAEYTTYCYGTSPNCMNGASWHYDDNPLQKSSQRTWDQFMGFSAVTTETGVAPDPVTETVDTYFQGMNGDYQGSGNPVTSATLTATIGGVTVTQPDNYQWAGQDFTHTVYDGNAAGAPIVSEIITTPWSSAATATQSGLPSPLPSLRAFMTGTAKTQTFTGLGAADAGGYRESDVDYAYDSYGRVTSEADVPDLSDNGQPGDSAEDTCTQTAYATNTSPSAWIFDLPSEVTVTAEPPADCPVVLPPPQSELISDTAYYYDGSSKLGAAPTTGNVTETKQATSDNNATPSAEGWTIESTDTYDEYGRVTAATDADGNTTITSFTPTTGAEPTSVTVTSPATANAPAGLQTVTTYDSVRELPLTVTSPAGLVTSDTYDALGRLTSVWSPGHAQASAPAVLKFTYAVSDTGPSVVTSDTITPTGTYQPSETLYDSLGRPVETQAETPDGGRDITDITFNSDGWPLVESGAYYATGVPSATLVDAPDDQVPSQTGYVYDGAGRVTRQIAYDDATETWETDTAYGGDYTTVTPPAGGTAETVYTNGDGKTSYIYQYHSATPPASPPAPGSGSQPGSSGWDQTAYTYTPSAQLAGITDDAGNQWSYGYNDAGEQVSATSPDSGTTSSAYDPDGNLVSVTDARGKTISYAYDADGRETAEYDTTGGAQETGSDELASWTYDTLDKGQLTSSSSYTGGTTGSAYTEAVLGYNSYGLATGTETIIPSSAGVLAGTYKQGMTYNAYDDLESSYYDYAAGGLPAETVNLGYDTSGDPVSLTSALWDYVPALSYTELGQPEEYAFGTTTEPVWLTNTYNQQTGQLTNSTTQAGTTPATLDSTSYGYDNAGLITSEADTPADGPDQVQCFTYNYLGQLTQAWAQGSTGCASAGSQSAEAGAAAPYWNQYTYNSEGDLTSQVSTPPTGAATTYASVYPAAGSSQPHAITSQAVTVGTGSPATTSYSYDASGDTTAITPPSGQASNLTWNDAGQLSTITAGTSQTPTAAYTYDASGSLLLQTDPGAGTATLYLPDEQLTATTSGTTTTVSGIRYYTIGGVTIAARTSGGTIDYLTGNQQGTSMLAVNAATLVPARRYYDPFGNPVGTPPATWPGTKGFVGGTADPATGLTNLGAREYNPATATFISTDAILDPFNPQDFNPYAYAADSPVSNSDPTGLMCMPGEAVADCNYHRTADQNGDGNGNSNGTADGPPGDECTPLTCPTPSVPEPSVVKQFIRSVFNGEPNSAQRERELMQAYDRAYSIDDGSPKDQWNILLDVCRQLDCSQSVNSVVQYVALHGKHDFPTAGLNQLNLAVCLLPANPVCDTLTGYNLWLTEISDVAKHDWVGAAVSPLWAALTTLDAPAKAAIYLNTKLYQYILGNAYSAITLASAAPATSSPPGSPIARYFSGFCNSGVCGVGTPVQQHLELEEAALTGGYDNPF